MLLSIYTYVKNSLDLDYHIVDMLKHHLPLADEIIVNEGYSTDGTHELISNIHPKIKVHRNHWAAMKGDKGWYIALKEAARQRASGDWCLALDSDEFIPDWDFERIRRYLTSATETMIPVRFVHFYANYKVYFADLARVKAHTRKMILHRNTQELEFWGDAANVRVKGTTLTWDTSPMEFTCHHFGWVRHPARLRQGWHLQAALYEPKRRRFSIPRFAFDVFPHEWLDRDLVDTLAIYEGPHVEAVRNNPEEFVRDGFKVYEFLRKQDLSRSAPLLPAE